MTINEGKVYKETLAVVDVVPSCITVELSESLCKACNCHLEICCNSGSCRAIYLYIKNKAS